MCSFGIGFAALCISIAVYNIAVLHYRDRSRARGDKVEIDK